MARVATEEVARLLAQRLVSRGAQGSPEWWTAWCRRWGSQVAQDTSANPLFQHPVVTDSDGEKVVVLGPDRVPLDLYREWKDLQDGSRTIRGTPDGRVFWED